MATGSPSTVPPKIPAPKPAAAVKAPTSEPAPEIEEQEAMPAGPIIERISIGSLVVKKTTWDDGDTEMTEVKTIKAGPDERFKSWRHAQPA